MDWESFYDLLWRKCGRLVTHLSLVLCTWADRTFLFSFHIPINSWRLYFQTYLCSFKAHISNSLEWMRHDNECIGFSTLSHCSQYTLCACRIALQNNLFRKHFLEHSYYILWDHLSSSFIEITWDAIFAAEFTIQQKKWTFGPAL
jgi:hypothetical protein